MSYTVKSRAGAFGGLSVLTPDPQAALAKAEEMEEDGLQDVRIVDEAGQMHAAADFRRLVAATGLTEHQVRLIEGTAGQFLSSPLRAAEIFYGRLFALAPETRSLFPDDMTKQKEKLIDTLASLVGAIRQPESLGELVVGLGRRHAHYGVEAGHYGPVGDALLTSLRQMLGADFTTEVEAAWTALYGEISVAMLRAQKAPSAAH